jgi:hypothetical protein
MNYIIRHSLRTLVKNGHPDALSFLGYGKSPVELSNLTFFDTVKMGKTQAFSFELISHEEQKVVVDYIVYFQNKQGKMSNKKIYKIKTLQMQAGKAQKIYKEHFFKSEMSTRVLYEGVHRIDIQVNGNIVSSFTFDLIH